MCVCICVRTDCIYRERRGWGERAGKDGSGRRSFFSLKRKNRSWVEGLGEGTVSIN